MSEQNLQSTLSSLSDKELLAKTFHTAKNEQRMTLELLSHLKEVDQRKVFATLGYESLWKYCVKELGYSESSAAERVSAMRLIFSVSGVKEKIASGLLNLTNAAKVQRFFQTEARIFGKKYSDEQKKEVLDKIDGASKRQVESVLFAISPEQKKIESRAGEGDL